MTVQATEVPDGARGFDCNERVSISAALLMKNFGYTFALRYVRRGPVNSFDLSPDEVRAILGARLGIMPVQHVKSAESWVPTPDLGTEYGDTAVADIQRCGIGPGVCAWLDLEGVAVGTLVDDVIGFCNNWYDRVKAAGFVPGIYVGWHAGLNGTQLYYKLRFEHYWSAYNLNADQFPAVRGVQLRQLPARKLDVPAGAGLTIDIDVAQQDSLGGRSIMWGS